jgi:alcohol dehydrogenase
MKAAVLVDFGMPLQIKSMPDPVAAAGEVVVEVRAAPVLPYAKEVFHGSREYPLTPPMVPGCGAVGRVLQTGPDATRLKPGDWVFCDPTLRPRDDLLTSDAALQGWDARGEAGAILQRHFLDGPFAERMRIPTENAIYLGELEESDASDWCAVNTLLIPFGGLQSIDFQPGETLLVNGATGHFGSAAVAVALSMGASKVIACGRNEPRLKDLTSRFGERVATVALTGDEVTDAAEIRAAGHGLIDCVLDFLPPSANARAARTAIMSVRPNGRVVLMGGVGLQGGDDLALPYPWFMLNNITVRGQWMYPRESARRLVALVYAGLLRLEDFTLTKFALDDANAAIDDAAAHPAPFRLTVVCP